MSCFVNPVIEDQCLFVTYPGASPVHEMMATRYVANRYLAMKHWNKIVVDSRNLQPMPTAIEVIGLAKDLSLDLPRSARIALVVSPEQGAYGRLVECVTQIEGMDLHMFFEIANTKAWAKDTAHDGQVKILDSTAMKNRF
jgi:hypothetical protein